MRHSFLYVFKEEAANMPTDEDMRLKGYAKERGPWVYVAAEEITTHEMH